VSALDRNRRQRCNVLDGEKQLSALYSTVGYRVVSENTVWFPTSRQHGSAYFIGGLRNDG